LNRQRLLREKLSRRLVNETDKKRGGVKETYDRTRPVSGGGGSPKKQHRRLVRRQEDVGLGGGGE